MKVNEEGTEEKMNKKIIFLISIATITFFALVGVVYAKYQKAINVTYEATTGEMICDVEIDTNDSYKVNGIPYFLVTVKNYTEENGTKTLTATDIEYYLTIKNNSDALATGMFVWKNEEKNDYISTYSETVTTNIYSFGKTADEDVFKVFVKKSNKLAKSASSLEVEVELNAIQKEED